MAQRRIIFLVHGMGEHGQKWADPWIKRLKGLYAQYEGTNLTRLEFDERFECIPLTYDNIFVDLLNRWRTEGANLAEAKSELEEVDRPDLFNLVERTLDEVSGDSFWSTHAADALLYRAIPLIREAVKAHVGQQIVSHLNQRAIDNTDVIPPWGVVSHSLGTIVTHDTLDAIWTLKLQGQQVNGFAPNRPGGMAQLVMMVSNVSRLLQSRPKVYDDTTVMPGPIAGTTVPDHPNLLRGCFRYVNVWNEFDPFVRPGKFSPQPPDWPDTESKSLFQEIKVDHIRNANTHDFLHYLDNPAVHLELFTTMSGRPDAVAAEKRTDALAAFEAKSDLPEQLIIDIKREVERLDVASDDLWPTISDLVKRFKENVVSLIG